MERLACVFVAVSMAGCRTGSERAAGEAREDLRERIAKLTAAARYTLDGATAEQARKELADNYGTEVFDSSVSPSGTVTWHVVLLAQGSDRYSWSYSAKRFRTCITVSARHPDVVKVANLRCPTSLDNYPANARPSQDPDLDLTGDFGNALNAPAPPTTAGGAGLPKRRFELPKDRLEQGEQHRLRIQAALQRAVEEGPLGILDVQRVLEPLGYDPSSVQARGRSDGAGGLALGISTGAGCVYGGIRQNLVDLQVGGGIADGGCLPAQSH